MASLFSTVVSKVKISGLLITAFTLFALFAAGATAGAAPQSWKHLPVLPVIKGKVKKAFRHDLRRSRRKAMRPKVFAKLGDSETEMVPALYGIGCRKVRLSGRHYLKSVIRRYTSVRLPNERAMPGCGPGNSFTRRSAAAQSGTYSTWSLTKNANLPTEGYWTAPSDCGRKETPMSCEIRAIEPRYTLIMTGTNDVGFDDGFGIKRASHTVGRMKRLISAVRKLGSVPVISTLPPLLTPSSGPGTIDPYNAAIARAAYRFRVPIINLWRALERPSMINSGMEDPGLHLRTIPGGQSPILEPGPTTFSDSVDFRRPALRYGSNLRNLIWLKTLARLDRVARRHR